MADVVDLPALLRIVRDVSPRLALERQAIAGAEADRITAGAYPNPDAERRAFSGEWRTGHAGGDDPQVDHDSDGA